jgi:hypothetical protein
MNVVFKKKKKFLRVKRKKLQWPHIRPSPTAKVKVATQKLPIFTLAIPTFKNDVCFK